MSTASQLIREIELDFAQLQKEYNQFFGGVTLVEPWELKEKLSYKLKRLRNLPNLRSAESFRADNLTAKIQSYLGLWERQLQEKMGSRKPKTRPEDQKEEIAPQEEPKKTKSAPQKGATSRRITIENPHLERENVVALYDEFARHNLQLGKRELVSFSKFQAFVQKQTSKIQMSKKAKKVSYEVITKDGKVMLKTSAQN